MALKKAQVAIGDRFRASGRSIFGNPLPEILQIESFVEKAGGIAHAILVRISSERETKMIAVSALLDGRLFIRGAAPA